jgi:FAD/FMN-containing dehydrogenase/Fe-S oxidoreductase
MFHSLANEFSGELFYDESAAHNAIRMSYATDASVYQEAPLAVALPKTVEDIRALIQFAAQQGTTLIPRAAGTSLAGQVVGRGIVVDISKYFTAVLEVNEQEAWVRVQPGVIRDDLNAFLKPKGWMFGPETSTASRAMIGGMIGNNSSGLHSISWGDTRGNLLEVKALLSDGSEAVFKALSIEAFDAKCSLQTLEGGIYRSLRELLQNDENKEAITTGFPKASITRRNTGYALDALLNAFQCNGVLNICQLIAGSEGTLCFITEATLKLQALPPKEKCIVAVHTDTIKAALKANIVALQHHCAASELVDDIILEYTKTNIDQSKNRFFVDGSPRAILMVEFFDTSLEVLTAKAMAFIEAVKDAEYGYAWPILYGDETTKAWDLRKAGLGLLRNEPGDIQPVNLIEDCAVDPEDLPDYIDEVEALLKKYSVKYSMYAHAGAGELHVEPMVNLKTASGKHLFRTILVETAAIVKKYNGSLSGEHGDGRLRGEFIPFMMGERNYQLFREVKNIFDPHSIFNRGKVIDTPPMNEALRYQQDVAKKEVSTLFDFSGQESILRLSEKCSGSGDCRKTHITGGTMCPSYMATRSERDTTRARANMLRHFYTNKTYGATVPVRDEEVLDVLDLCLSCKACKSECPSSVDVGKMKAEFLQQYYDKKGVPLRSKLVGSFASQMALASTVPWAYNLLFNTPALRKTVNKVVGFHPERTMPLLHKTTLRKWWHKHRGKTTDDSGQMTGEGTQSSVMRHPSSKKVYLFCDEFTNYNDVEVGRKAILLLEALGYQVQLPEHGESGRTWLSKGLVRKAKELATRNVSRLREVVSSATPIIGIEPSAILTLRDEYPELVTADLVPAAKELAKNTFLFEEWLSAEIAKGEIKPTQFAEKNVPAYIHGHCHQKSLSSVKFIKESLAIVPGFRIEEIPSGCCGMAGSFGYEKEHYEVSMKIGGLVLFPAVKMLGAEAIIAASGTSCRHQIKDGTGRKSQHTAEILFDALLHPPISAGASV